MTINIHQYSQPFISTIIIFRPYRFNVNNILPAFRQTTIGKVCSTTITNTSVQRCCNSYGFDLRIATSAPQWLLERDQVSAGILKFQDLKFEAARVTRSHGCTAERTWCHVLPRMMLHDQDKRSEGLIWLWIPGTSGS